MERARLQTEASKACFTRANQVIPGGVNSPVRAFKAVGGTPPFIKRANGAYLYDVDGNRYLDYVMSWGPLILGHNDPRIRKAVGYAAQNGLSFGAPHESEVLLAERVVSLVPGLDMVRMVNSGTEAVMSALRLARAYTKRTKVIKFEGCYHGHADSMLVKAGSGALTCGQPDSWGVPPSVAADTLIASYNNLEQVEDLLKAYDVACVIVEPVAANMGVVLPKPGFLEGLRSLCDAYGSLLIFDEVITGFRLASGGAQEYFGVLADLCVFGKIIGGGMPVGAYGGKRQIMELVAPLGPVYQAGTLSGNPLAMAAGSGQLEALEDAGVYRQLEEKGTRLAQGLKELIDELEVKACVNQVGSLLSLFFGIDRASDYKDVCQADTQAFKTYFNLMLNDGIYLAPSPFEAMFISTAHSAEDIQTTLERARGALMTIRDQEAR